jgi:chromosome partitioning protein
MARTICVANQKGGVGKTSTAINLGTGFAKGGLRTVLVDLDPQCNATTGLGGAPLAHHPMLRTETLASSIAATENQNLWLLPGCRAFQDVNLLDKGGLEQSTLLQDNLIHALSGYDCVLIDCPPSLGQLTRAALTASTEVLIPIQCEFYAMEGVAQMVQAIKQAMQSSLGRLTLGGILLTMYDPSLDLTYEVEKDVREFFGDIVFDTYIPRDVAISEAPSHGQSVLDYSPRSRGSRAYIELCMEVLDRD